jgi:hypothetical protein
LEREKERNCSIERTERRGSEMVFGEHFEGVKEHWKKNFSFLDYFKKTYGRDQPLPKWTDADVEEFIASDPIYGPQVSPDFLLLV